MAVGGFNGAGTAGFLRQEGDNVIWAQRIFSARRGDVRFCVGDSVIVQTAQAGQVRATIMGAGNDGGIKVRFSRWGALVTVEPDQVIRLAAEGVA